MIKRHPLEWLTKAEEQKLRKNYETNMKRFDPPYLETNFSPVVRFFNPVGLGSWYIAELSPENVGYGLCCFHDLEIGYVSLNELSQLHLPLGATIEKDRSFEGKKLTLMQWKDKLKPDYY